LDDSQRAPEHWGMTGPVSVMAMETRTAPQPRYCEMELAVAENALFALAPIKRMVPTTKTRITANITAYSAMS